MPNLNFDYFDPLTGESPSRLEGVFNNLISRARKMLKGVPRETIESGLETLIALFENEANRKVSDIYDGLSLEEMAELLAQEENNPERQNDNVDSDENPFPSDAQILHEALIHYHLDLVDNKLDWPQYFAVLALTSASEAVWLIEFHKNNRKNAKRDYEEDRYEIAGYSIVRMMEAISIAEYLQREKEVLQESKEKLSLRNTVASYKKHNATNEILYELRNKWNTGNFNSYAELVTHYLDNTPEQKLRHISKTNRQRTLTQGLSAVLNNKRQSFIEYERTLA